MSNLLEIIEGKEVKDFSREELEVLALEYKVKFDEKSKDATIFNRLVKSLEVEEDTKEVKILLPVARVYKLSANVNDVVSYPKTLAEQLVEDKYAEFVK